MEADGGPLNSTTSDICRVTTVTPNRSADLALPTYLPLADLLPTLACIVDHGIVDEANELAVALIFSLVVPTAAFRLAGMRMPDLPQTVDDINRPAEPIEEAVVARRTESADQYVTAMYAAVSNLVLIGVLTLVHERRWTGIAYAGVVSLILLFRAHVLSGLWQRVWLIGAALGTSRLLPGRTIRPYWGRSAEILETLLAVVLIPLGLAAIGLLAFARQLSSPDADEAGPSPSPTTLWLDVCGLRC
jgi:hypothetical protein